MAGGVLEIPVGAEKPLKPSKDNSYARAAVRGSLTLQIMYCATGVVRVRIYRSIFTIAEGGLFLVPRGNNYSVTNIGHDDVRLIFMQSRQVTGIPLSPLFKL